MPCKGTEILWNNRAEMQISVCDLLYVGLV